MADNDCSERLWAANAAVLGDDLVDGDESSFTRLDVLKKNTFCSQWCDGARGDAPFQVASVRPAINLLLDPAAPNRGQPRARSTED